MTGARRVRAFGDGALVVDVEDIDEAAGLASAVAGETGEPGIEDVIVGFRSVVVVADPTTTDVDALAETVSTLPAVAHRASSSRHVEIPVAFDGDDLVEVAATTGLSPGRVVAALVGCELRVAFVGFAPGFGYLTGLPPELAGLPRRATPRLEVPAGALALAGGFAGVYPRSSPGGWNLLGRTDMTLFDPAQAPYSVLRAGDVVRLRESQAVEGVGQEAGWRAPLSSDAWRTVRVEDAGLLSFVQDGGRIGLAGAGIPRGGAADPYARRRANLMVGNDESAAVVEATARGPRLVFSDHAHVAVVGDAAVSIDGRVVPPHTVVAVGAGQTLAVGTTTAGLRTYIAVAGGFDLPAVLGGRSSDVLSGLGAGPLASGDVLGIGPPGRPRGAARPPLSTGEAACLRIMAGPDPLPRRALDSLLETTWEVDGASDRIGVRLRGPTAIDVPASPVASKGMVTGAVQVPPDGLPIVLSCDHATVGGYPVVATVVSADQGVLGQLRPGQEVRFEPTDIGGARRARAAQEQMLRQSVTGWYPIRTQ
jgi:KipI family sensor histidine kinase inhibitor